MNERIPFIDFAKGFSIFAIIIYHYCLPLDFGWLFQQMISFGGTGIHLFFFLSGFGLGLGRKTSLLVFYKRRFIKILLPYYIFVTLVFLINLVHPVYHESGVMTWLSHIFLYKMFSNDLIISFGYQLWFISTIIQFYLFFPIMRWMKEKAGNLNFILIAFLVSSFYIVFITFIGHNSDRDWNSFFLTFFWEFAIGFFLANSKKPQWFLNLKTWHYIVALFLGVAFMGILNRLFGQTGRLFNDFPALFAFISLVAIVYRISNFRSFKWVKNFFMSIAKVSFEIYLVHYYLFSLLFLFLIQVKINYTWYFVPIVFLFVWMVALGFRWLIKSIEQKIKFLSS